MVILLDEFEHEQLIPILKSILLYLYFKSIGVVENISYVLPVIEGHIANRFQGKLRDTTLPSGRRKIL